MRNSRKFIGLVWLIMPVMAAIAFFVTLKAQQQGSARSQNDRSLDEILAQLPIADFYAQPPRDPEKRQRRQERNDRHNFSGGPHQPPVLNENMESVLLNLPLSHGPEEPAIPSTTSDAIVLGSITDQHAYISSDKTSVYSEVKVKVEEVLKAEPRYPLTTGSTFEAERPGGAVRFPSGKILRRGFLGRNLPQQGHRYLLFLIYNEEGQNFTILTGYKISAGHISPLDGVPESKEGFTQFRSYENFRGVEASAFLQTVRAAINNQHSTPNGRG